MISQTPGRLSVSLQVATITSQLWIHGLVGCSVWQTVYQSVDQFISFTFAWTCFGLGRWAYAFWSIQETGPRTISFTPDQTDRLGCRLKCPVKLRPKIPERFIKINNIYAFDDFQQQLVTRIPPNEKLDTPFGYNHLSIMQYSSYS